MKMFYKKEKKKIGRQEDKKQIERGGKVNKKIKIICQQSHNQSHNHYIIQRPEVERSTILQKVIKDKKFYYPTKSQDKKFVQYYQSDILNKKTKTKSLSYIKN